MSNPWSAITYNNSMCTDHGYELQRYHDDIIKSSILASQLYIKSKIVKKNKVILGWNDIVNDRQQQPLFWHFLWKSNGCHFVGVISDIRQASRAKCHFSVKQANKLNKLAADLMNNNYIDFWKKEHRIKAE